MIIDGTGRDSETFEADVCVIGAGAAGLTLALDLAKRGLSVLLVESGGLEFSKQAQGLLEVDFSGKSRIDNGLRTRARFFGGTTNLWGGICLPLDPFEFEHHSWVPHSGWPFSRNDLDPYYLAATELLGLQGVEAVFDPESMGAGDRTPLVNDAQTDVEHTYFRRLPAERQRMGKWRHKEVATNPLVQCVLNTTIVELFPGKSRDSIASVVGRTFNGDTLHFRARDFVLCTSAIENARLLLASNSVIKGGLGNAHDLVGRYFMIHPPIGRGFILPVFPEVPRTQEELISDKFQVGWQISAAAREKYQLQAFHVFLLRRPYFLERPYEAAIEELVRSPAAPKEDPESIKRKMFMVNWEQAPNPRSRIMLSSTKDELGVRRPLVHIDVTEEDFARAQRSFELLSLAVARSGRGRLFISDIIGRPLAFGGGHQIGTTRMADDSRQGVTDANGKVHSLKNLYIGGSSLFPTGGWQNPTFTIVALALKLAEHIHGRSGKAREL